jgi:hypothetical protein
MPWIDGEWVDDPNDTFATTEPQDGAGDTGANTPGGTGGSPQYPTTDPWNLYDQNTQGDPQTVFTDPYGYDGSNPDDPGMVNGEGMPPGWLSKLGSGLANIAKNSTMGGGGSGGGLGSAGSQAAGSAAAGRKSEAELALERDRNRASIYGTQQNAALNAAQIDLLRRKYLATVPEDRLTAAAHGDRLANVQDVQLAGGSPQVQAHRMSFTGGARPSNLSPATRALGAKVAADMLKQQQTGDTFDPVSSLLLPAPTEMNMPQASILEKYLGLSSLIPTLIGTGTNAGSSILSILDLLASKGGGDQSVAGQMANG